MGKKPVEVINVITVKDGVVDNVDSFLKYEESDHQIVQDAEACFKETCEKINKKPIDEEEMECATEDGFWEKLFTTIFLTHSYTVKEGKRANRQLNAFIKDAVANTEALNED